LSLFNELQCVNRLVADCEIIGESTSGIQINNDNDSRRLISRINQKTSYLDVAAITSLSRTGNRIIKYQRKDNVFSSNIQMFDELREPLSYPLFFPYGSGGWGSFRVQTLDRQPKTATVPHICFKFRISFQESYKMLRLQSSSSCLLNDLSQMKDKL
jgi:hypothetical protein